VIAVAEAAGLQQPRRFLLRFVLWSVLLGLMAHFGSPCITEALLPVFKDELALLDPAFRIDRLYVDRDGADEVVRLEVGLARTLSVGSRTFRPDPRDRASTSTLADNAVVPCALLIAASLAWPLRSRRELAMRLAALAPAALLLEMLVVPFILLAQLWAALLSSAAPGRFSVLVSWGDFLTGGGALALALILAVAAIQLPRRILL